MVVPAALAFDIISNSVSLALPGLVWGLLFVLAWRRPAFAESIGLGRREFWLLLPGSLAATFAIVPIAPVSRDVLALSLSGAVFPLTVATLTLRKFAPPFAHSAGTLFGAIGLESVALLVPLLPETSHAIGRLGTGTWGGPTGAIDLVEVGIAVAFGLGMSAYLRIQGGDVRLLATYLGTSAVIVLTFLGTEAIPGVGIVEAFPYFLIPPLAAGMAVGAVAGRIFPRETGYALALAFFVGSWGTLLGADLLRQPGLYGSGPGGLYVIGGAGVLDLVYLSGFLGLAGAFLVHGLAERPFAPLGSPPEAAPPNPIGRLQVAYDRGLRGDLAGSLRASADAADAAAAQARRLRTGEPTRDPDRPWDGLPVPGWVVSDHANLRSASRSTTSEPVEALRSWLTARWLVRTGGELSRPRFASVPQRIAAFAVDLAIVLGASGAIFLAIAFAVPGSLDGLFAGLGYNTAIYACISGAFLYFVLAELWGGMTVGMLIVGLEVRDRSYRRPDGFTSLVRNVSHLPTLTVAVLGVAVAAGVAAKGTTAAAVGGIGLPTGVLEILGVGAFVGGGVALFGALAVLAITVSFERQRVGDRWAGTWVVRAGRGRGAPPPAPGPPGPGRSG